MERNLITMLTSIKISLRNKTFRNIFLLILQNSELLTDLQGTDKQGTWAQCSIPSCGKWRFLQSNVDPNELPERWVCAMNESRSLLAC